MTSDLSARFRTTWQQLALLGHTSKSAGYHRFAWGDADLACRDWFRSEAERRDLAVERDRNGNLWAWWDVSAERREAVVTGSHLDSVPGGGAFDGPLGVVGGLLAIDLLRERGAKPTRTLAVACFADEEGSRFGVACAGSRLLTGALSPARAQTLRDSDGVSMATAMGAAGVPPEGLGRDGPLLELISVFVELHIEQGRQLVHAGSAVGLATEIWPHGRWRVTFTGEGNHAGTTRLQDRSDPVLPLASTVLAARRAAHSAGGVATIGRIEVDPNAVNAVAAAASAWLDARGPDDSAVDAVLAAVTEAAQGAAAEHGVGVRITEESRSPRVGFPPQLRQKLAATLGRSGIASAQLPTGAGHDAGILSAELPTAMLFVRNPTGVSHSPAEWAEEADCLVGIEALAAVLEELACR